MTRVPSGLAPLALAAALMSPLPAAAQLPALRDRPLGAAERVQLARLETDLVRISARERTSVAALRSVARALGPRLTAESPENLVRTIEDRARQLSTLQRSLNEAQARLDALDSRRVAAAVEPRLTEAREAVESGELERADGALLQVAEAFRTARQTQQAQLEELGRGEASALAERARLAALVGEFERAAEFWGQALAATPASDTALRWRYGLDEAYMRVNLGSQRREPQMMAAQIDRIRNEVLPLAPRDQRPLDYAETLMIIGASEACACMAELSAQRMPQAMQAFAAAAEIITPESDRRRWLDLQIYRAGTLSNLASLENNPTRSHEALAVYAAARSLGDRDSWPDRYRLVEAGYGTLLLSLHGDDPARRTEALDALRRAVEVSTPGSSRLTAQYGLAAALTRYGQRLRDRVMLDEAEPLLRVIMAESAGERDRSTWAAAQDLFGQLSLGRYAVDRTDPAPLQAAETALRAALTVFDREQQGPRRASTASALATTLVFQVQAGGDPAKLDEVESLLRDAAAAAGPTQAQTYARAGRSTLAQAELLRAERRRDPAAAARAEALFRQILAETPAADPNHAGYQRLLSRAAAARTGGPTQPS